VVMCPCVLRCSKEQGSKNGSGNRGLARNSWVPDEKHQLGRSMCWALDAKSWEQDSERPGSRSAIGLHVPDHLDGLVLLLP
jgi:hypothetical protein